MQYAAVLIVLLIAAGIYAVLRGRSKRKPVRPAAKAAGNVISMDSHRKAKRSAQEQLCSSCKRKNGKLIFYAQDNGSIIGLCKDCKDKAKKRDLLPL